MRLWAAFWLILAASPALATVEDWPALYDVAGVNENDVLNIRAAPSADAPVVGTLSHDASNLEVIEPNDAETWGRVNTAEGTGWISLSFADRQAGQWWGRVPPVTSCYGTEPFWTLATVDGAFAFASPDGESWTAPISSEAVSEGSRFFAALTAQGAALVIRRELCSDGMSDRVMGLSGQLVLSGPDGSRLMTGCCTIAPAP